MFKVLVINTKSYELGEKRSRETRFYQLPVSGSLLTMYDNN